MTLIEASQAALNLHKKSCTRAPLPQRDSWKPHRQVRITTITPGRLTGNSRITTITSGGLTGSSRITTGFSWKPHMQLSHPHRDPSAVQTRKVLSTFLHSHQTCSSVRRLAGSSRIPTRTPGSLTGSCRIRSGTSVRSKHAKC